jgi:hypothetical protein
VRAPSDWSAEIARLLDRAEVEWTVIGALAADQYRLQPRTTTDADFLARRSPALREALESSGYSVQAMHDPDGEPYAYFVRGDDMKADVLVAETAYQEEAIIRSRGTFLTIEDVLVHKLIAWRAKDQDDIRSILQAGHGYDGSYVERWAAEWGVLDRWAEITATPTDRA